MDRAAGSPRAGLAIHQAGEFEAGAAEVTHQALGGRRAGENAQRRIAGLLDSREHPQLQTGFHLDPATEGAAIPGVADRGRGDGVDLRRPAGVDEGAEAIEGDDGGIDAVRRQAVRGGDIPAEAGEDFFVVDRPDGPAIQPVHDQTYGVRAYIDDRGVGLANVIAGGRHVLWLAADP